MKKSELKDYIKEQIIDVLSEATPEEVENQKELNKELEKTADLMSKMDMKEEEEDAPAGDKTVQAKASKQDKIIKDFKRIEAQMKTHLELFKTSESPENKETAKQMLKKLTPEYQAVKKAYDKLKNVKV
jgi:DNA-binding ferritin-like protein